MNNLGNCYDYTDEQAGTKLVPINASVQTLKNGAWCCSENHGQPGTISNVKMSKTGKHGHAKFTFNLSFPFTGQTSQEMYPGHTHLTRPVINKYELMVCAYDPWDEEQGGEVGNSDDLQPQVTCMDDKFEECVAYMHPEYKKDAKANEQFTGPKFFAAYKEAMANDLELVCSIIEGPVKKSGGTVMVRQIEKWQLKDPADN